jgi:hypothetical protein
MFSSQNSQVSGAAADPYFNQTTLLLHGDGTNGAQNNTFLDSSTNNFTITRNGNATQGTFTPFSQAAGYWDNYFDGTGDYLSLASNAAFTVGTGDLTIEAWVYITSFGIGYAGILSGRVETGPNYPGLGLVIDANKFSFTILNNSNALIDTVDAPTNQWVHVVGVRSGTSAALFVNGVRKVSSTNSENGTSSAMNLGRFYPATDNYYFNGYISNARIIKGTAVYDPTQTTLTVPTTPLTAITNTSLLTCQSNRFVDNSTNNFTLTANGNVAVQPFSPFAPTAAYSTAVNGGSGYFNGTSDYLSLSSTAGAFRTSNFTVEGWVFSTQTQSGSGAYFFCGDTTAFVLGMIGDKVSCGYSLVAYTYTGVISIPNNTWTHISAVRNGSTTYVYVNGVLDGSFSDTRDYNPTISYIAGITTSYNFFGYVSNIRAVNGTAVYTAAFTPPTAPVTAISGTSLLTNFTNAGIFDNAMKNDLETVGNAQISTSVVKYGTGSMALDGTGDYLTAPQSTLYDFGTGDFTVEFWTYMNATADTTFISKFISGAYAWLVQYISGTGLRFYWGNNGTLDSFVVGSWSPSTSTWYHVAVTRASGTLRLFIDGTQVGTTTNSSSYTSVTSLSIGRNADAGGIQYLNGYMDDIRITKGVARYTAAFTPPTAAFSNQ